MTTGMRLSHFDLTDFLSYGAKNYIVLRVDASFGDGWFYEGAGVYRHVWLTKTDAVHLGKWESTVRTAVERRLRDALAGDGGDEPRQAGGERQGPLEDSRRLRQDRGHGRGAGDSRWRLMARRRIRRRRNWPVRRCGRWMRPISIRPSLPLKPTAKSAMRSA